MMIERCPACKARKPGHETCRRCQANLRWLSRIQAAVEHEEYCVVQQLLQNRPALAQKHLHKAMPLHQTGFVQALAGFMAWQESETFIESPPPLLHYQGMKQQQGRDDE